jgi:hypothetical protein
MIPRLAAATLAAFVLLAGCTTVRTYKYGIGEIPPTDSRHRIVAVTTASGARVTFDTPADPPVRVDEGAIVGMANGEPLRMDLSDTRSVWIEEKRTSIGRTLLLGAGLFFGIGFLSRR